MLSLKNQNRQLQPAIQSPLKPNQTRPGSLRRHKQPLNPARENVTLIAAIPKADVVAAEVDAVADAPANRVHRGKVLRRSQPRKRFRLLRQLHVLRREL
jgi:hypothetical protein